MGMWSMGEGPLAFIEDNPELPIDSQLGDAGKGEAIVYRPGRIARGVDDNGFGL